MRLAFAEFRRNKGRFISIIFAVGFIVFLVLILAGLADGLYFGATGFYRNGNADLYSYDADARRSIVRSELPVETMNAVRAIDGVTDAGGGFSIDLPMGDYRIEVSAPAFETYSDDIAIRPGMDSIEVVLDIASVTESLVVNATMDQLIAE